MTVSTSMKKERCAMRLVAIIILALLNSGHSAAEPQCTTPKTTTMKFSLSSYRNPTGQWMSQVGLGHDGGTTISHQTAPWSVDIEHNTTTTCDGEEAITIIATLSASNATATPQKQIPAGYELFPGVGYYKFHPVGVIWARARQVCAEEGAHLVIINSENEANVIKQLFTRFPKEKISDAVHFDFSWVGVYEQGVNGQYFTIFGSPLNSTGFARWHGAEPNDKGTDDCIFVHRPSAAFFDYPCTTTSPFVCEL